MSETYDSTNVVFINNEVFDNNVQQLDSTAQILTISDSAVARELPAKGTNTIAYLSDKIRFMNDVANAYKDFISNNVKTILVDTKDNINKTCQTAGDNVGSGNGH